MTDPGKTFGDQANIAINDAYSDGTRDGMFWAVEGVLKESFGYLSDVEIAKLDSHIRLFMNKEISRRDKIRGTQVIYECIRADKLIF